MAPGACAANSSLKYSPITVYYSRANGGMHSKYIHWGGFNIKNISKTINSKTEFKHRHLFWKENLKCTKTRRNIFLSAK